MSSLNIRFHKAFLETVDISEGIVARVLQLQDVTGFPPEQPLIRELVIPAGRHETARVNCPAGLYRIHAFLPSGELLQEEYQIAPEETATIELTDRGALHEWLSWATLSGAAPSRGAVEHLIEDVVDWAAKLVPTAIPERPKAEDLVDIPQMESLARGVREAAAVSSVSERDDATRRSLRQVASIFGRAVSRRSVEQGDLYTVWLVAREAQAVNPARPEIGLLEPNVYLVSVPSWPPVSEWGFAMQENPIERSSTSYSRIFLWGTESRTLGVVSLQGADASFVLWTIRWPPDAPQKLWPIFQFSPGHPAWILAEYAGVGELIRLPTFGWSTGDPSDSPTIELLFDRRPSIRSHRFSLSIRDPWLGGLLSYMRGGFVGSARPVLKRLLDSAKAKRVFEASEDPFKALALVYAELATLDAGGLSNVVDRLRSLTRGFDWIPDAHLLLARVLLLRSSSAKDVWEGRALLAESYLRGIPFFAVGIEHLRNSLALFEKDSPYFARMHKTVAHVAGRVDPRQVFTSLQYPRGSSEDLRGTLSESRSGSLESVPVVPVGS